MVLLPTDAGITVKMVYSRIVQNITDVPKSSPSNTLPWIFLVAGVLLGIASGVLALNPDSGSAPVVLGAGAAIMAICLTFIIALKQNADTDDLRQLSTKTHNLGGATHVLGEKTNQVLVDIQSVLFKIEEQTADRAYSPTAEPLPEGVDIVAGSEDVLDKPSYAHEVIDALRERKANLDFDNLLWRRKIPSSAMTGNHGWFVESNSGGNERWFVRKANGITVRKAMPRDFLEALEEKAALDPREIKHDFQLTDHGLAAWYARTYSDVLWKVSRSNRNASLIGVSRENQDS